MDSFTGVAVFALAVFAVSAVVSKVPLVIRSEESRIHTMLAISAGIMLGVLFLMILPEAIEESEENGFSFTTIGAIILAGFILVYVTDFLVNIKNGHEHTHEFTSMAAFGGLALHAVFDGISLAAGFVAGEDVGIVILVAMCIHKCAEVFSLSTTMSLSMDKKRTTLYMLAFSAVSPIAMVVSYFLISGVPAMTGPAMALSCGILLFVIICDMLPEVFHHIDHDSPAKRMLSFIGGIAVAVAVWGTIFLLTNGQGL